MWLDCTQIQLHSPYHHRPKMRPLMKSNLSAIKNNYFKCILEPNFPFLLRSIYNICIICWKHLHPNSLANLPKTPFFLLLCCSSYVYSFDIETQLNKFIFSAWENSLPYTRLCVCVRPKLNPLCKNWITSLCVLKYESVHRDIFVIILSFFNTSMFSLSHLQRSPIRRKKNNSLSINIDILFYFCQRSSVNASLRIFFFIHFDWIFI